jgi:hypothetical protein
MAILRHSIPGLVPVTPRGSKLQRVMRSAVTEKDRDARAMSMVSLAEAGNLILPHPLLAPWVWDFIDQCAAFPKAKHDDLVDTATQALKHLRTTGMLQRADEINSDLERSMTHHGAEPAPLYPI